MVRVMISVNNVVYDLFLLSKPKVCVFSFSFQFIICMYFVLYACVGSVSIHCLVMYFLLTTSLMLMRLAPALYSL